MEDGSLWRLNGGDEGSCNSNKKEASSDSSSIVIFQLKETNFVLVILRHPVSFSQTSFKNRTNNVQYVPACNSTVTIYCMTAEGTVQEVSRSSALPPSLLPTEHHY
jgi:hypothetical protein